MEGTGPHLGQVTAEPPIMAQPYRVHWGKVTPIKVVIYEIKVGAGQ